MAKRIRFIIIVCVALAALVLIKIFVFSDKQTETAGRKDTKTPENVNIYIVKAQDLDNKVMASGVIRSDMEAQLKPEISGRIIKISFTEGGMVKKGQLLVKLNDADLQAQMKKLEIQQKLASEKLGRQKKLLAINGISQEEYDNALAQHDALVADIELLKAQIDKTEIRAPFNGTAGLRAVDEGQYVTPAITVVALQKTDPLKIDFSVPEEYASQIVKGDAVQFTVKGSDELFTAEVDAVEPRSDEATHTVAIRAVCNNRNKKLIPGSFAEVQLVLKKIENALMIPTEAVIPVLKGQKVYLYRSGKVAEQMIKTGLRTDRLIMVKEGITEGDTVITTGIMNIRAGASVKIRGEIK